MSDCKAKLPKTKAPRKTCDFVFTYKDSDNNRLEISGNFREEKIKDLFEDFICYLKDGDINYE